jgi:hypothetical protein
MPPEAKANELILIEAAAPYLARAAMANEITIDEVEALRAGTIALEATRLGTSRVQELLETLI